MWKKGCFSGEIKGNANERGRNDYLLTTPPITLIDSPSHHCS